jgi:hypothetical protein
MEEIFMKAIVRRADISENRRSEMSALLARLEALERDHAALTRVVADLVAGDSEKRSSESSDPLRDQRRLSAIALVFGESVFVVADVIESSDRELRETLQGVSRRRLGAWLRRMKGRPVGGYVLERSKREAGGYGWSLAVCPDIHAPR